MLDGCHERNIKTIDSFLIHKQRQAVSINASRKPSIYDPPLTMPKCSKTLSELKMSRQRKMEWTEMNTTLKSPHLHSWPYLWVFPRLECSPPPDDVSVHGPVVCPCHFVRPCLGERYSHPNRPWAQGHQAYFLDSHQMVRCFGCLVCHSGWTKRHLREA